MDNPIKSIFIFSDKHGDNENISVEQKEDESPSDEELFPEAREALRREAVSAELFFINYYSTFCI